MVPTDKKKKVLETIENEIQKCCELLECNHKSGFNSRKLLEDLDFLLESHHNLCKYIKKNSEKEAEDEESPDIVFVEWVSNMENNSDGSKGERWSVDEVENIVNKYWMGTEKITSLEWWVALNMVYSDYCRLPEKFKISDKTEFYFELAKLFLVGDKDGKGTPCERLLNHYKYMVKK